MGTVAELQVEAPVRVEQPLCSRYRCSKSHCAACAMVCPVPGAVRLGEEGASINAACVGCGACVSACPNGALRLPESDRELAARVRQRVQPGAVFRFACASAEGEADVVSGCLSRLTEAIVLEAIRGGARHVELLAPDCSVCGLGKAAPQWERVVGFANALCASAGHGGQQVKKVAVRSGKAVETHRPAPAVSPRRAMFQAIAERWKISGEAIEAEAASASETPKPFREIVHQHGENTKRTDLLAVLGDLPVVKAVPVVLPAAAAPLARVEVDSRCVGCNVCETLCPVGALRHSDEGGMYRLELDAACCTGCRVCELACFHQVLRLCDTVDVAVLHERPQVTLISAVRRTCRGCRESFLGDAFEYCPLCRLSGERRDAAARRFFTEGNQGDRS